MIKCPFCHFDNEDGALFCERCTSDLTAVATPGPALQPAPAPLATPMLEPEPLTAVPYSHEPIDPIPMAPLAVATPIDLQPMDFQPMHPMHNVPVALEPLAPMHPAPVVSPIPVVEPSPYGPTTPQMQPPMAAPMSYSPVAEPPPGPLPIHAQPRLLVLRGQKRNIEYPIYEGANFIGRADEKPVDIDLEEQEPPDRIWCSRQHACISFEDNQLLIEDLNSANGTYVNRTRVYPGQKRPLAVNDIVQIGNVQLKVLA